LGREATEDVVEEGERVDVEVLTSAGKGVEDGCRSTATIAP